MADLGTSSRVLLQAATGAGKTIIFCEVIRRFLNANPGMNVVVMAHRQELVTQARDKLMAVWPASSGRIGIACAGIGAVDTSAQVVIGSVQTLARRDWRGKHIGLLIVDEADHIPPAGANSQYNKVISKLTAANPALKCIGVTATPMPHISPSVTFRMPKAASASGCAPTAVRSLAPVWAPARAVATSSRMGGSGLKRPGRSAV